MREQTDTIKKNGEAAPEYDPAVHRLLRSRKANGKELLVYSDKELLHAWVWIHADSFFEYSDNEVREIVEDSAIHFDPQALEAIRLHFQRLHSNRANPEEYKPQLIATGRPAIDAISGYIHWLRAVPKENHIYLSEDSQGRVDFREQGRILNVLEGDLLATLKMPSTGTPGQDILGYKIPPKPAISDKLLPGERIVHDPETGEFKAGINGHAYLRGNTLCVDAIFHVRGNVDFNIGNIVFDGAVSISGDVREGFKVTALEHIWIAGSVHDARLKSDADMDISGGFTGRDYGAIRCGGRLTAKHLVNCRGSIGGDVYIQTEVVNANLSVGGRVLVPNGKIVGGHISALGGVEVRVLGTQSGTKTSIIISADSYLSDEARTLKTQISELETNAKSIEGRLGPFMQNKSLVDALQPSKREVIMQLLSQMTKIRNRLIELHRQRDTILARYSMQINDEVIVYGTLHNGVDITIDGCRKVFSESINGPMRLTPNYIQGNIAVESI